MLCAGPSGAISRKYNNFTTTSQWWFLRESWPKNTTGSILEKFSSTAFLAAEESSDFQLVLANFSWRVRLSYVLQSWCDQVCSEDSTVWICLILFGNYGSSSLFAGVWHVFGVLRVMIDIFEAHNLKTKPHVMQKPCSLRHPQVLSVGWNLIKLISVSTKQGPVPRILWKYPGFGWSR